MRLSTTGEPGHGVETITISNHAAVRVLTMDRPEVLNSVNRVMMDELADAFIAAGADDTVKVLVLTGAGRAFSAGADISEMDAPRASHPPGQGKLDVVIGALIDLPKPFVAAFNGLGAGYGATVCGLAAEWMTAAECVEAGLASEAVEPEALWREDPCPGRSGRRAS